MPTPSDQQPGILAAILGALAGGGIFGAIINWWVGVINRKTQLELKQADKPGAFTDDLQAELTSLRAQGLAQSAALVLSDDKHTALRNEFTAHMLASVDRDRVIAREEVEREKKIAHLENELEKLTNKLTLMEGEKITKDKAHLDEITLLKQQLAERDATIIVLRQEIADFKKIGVLEPPVPKRQTGGTL